MKLAIAAAALIAASIAAPSAFAQNWYAGADYTHFDFDGANVGGVTGRLGYKFTPHLAVEGEGTVGVDNDSSAELDNAYGVYGVGTLPVTGNLDVFGRVGWQRADVNGRNGAPGFTEDGVGYGAGLNYHFANGFGIRGQYTRLDGGDGGPDADTYSLGGVLNF